MSAARKQLQGWVGFVLLGGLCAGAVAQYGYSPVRNPAVDTSARRFEVGAQYGGVSLNSPFRPTTPLLGGNLIATGNVRGGLALRSFSPIADPLAFRAGLPSGQLSGFVRDSVSVADVALPVGPTSAVGYRPFYDPGTTAPTAGFLMGRPTTADTFLTARQRAELYRPASLPGMLDYGVPLDMRLDASLATSAITDPNRGIGAELSSSIFGVRDFTRRRPGEEGTGQRLPFQQPGYEPPAPRDPRDIDLTNMEEPGPPPLTAMPGGDRGTAGPIGQPMGSPIGQPLDFTRGVDVTSRLAPPAPSSPFGPAPSIGAPSSPPLSVDLPSPRPEKPATVVVPGRDLFTDLQLVTALEQDPTASWFEDIRTAIREDASITGRPQELARLESEQFIARVKTSRLQSLAGEGDDGLNVEMRTAESLLRTGRYMDAVRSFQRAQLYDPQNPLPLIGRGHAQLAAGDYLSAAMALMRGLERFPEFATFPLDASAMLGGGEAVDIRRADLMRRLAEREDPTMRFLLGYIEYHSGDRERGLSNLERAAERAEPGSILRRYPDLLRGRGVAPPPKLMPLDPPLPPEGSAP